MGIPAYTGAVLPFIASIVIGTIQLGSTVDYAILMSTRYKLERNSGKDKTEAVTIALSTSIKSIIVCLSRYKNTPTVPHMLRGNTVADAGLIIASIDPCFSCLDR